MDIARPKKAKNPLTEFNDKGAVYFDFLFRIPVATPLDELHFIAFMSDELGLNATATLGDECLYALTNDEKCNWLSCLIGYTYSRIYEKLCWMTDTKLSTSGRQTFQKEALKRIKLTILGNKVTLSAGPNKWSSLKETLKENLQPQTRQPQIEQPQVEPPRVEQAQVVPPQAERPRADPPRVIQHMATPRKANRHYAVLEPSLRRLKPLR